MGQGCQPPSPPPPPPHLQILRIDREGRDNIWRHTARNMTSFVQKNMWKRFSWSCNICTWLVYFPPIMYNIIITMTYRGFWGNVRCLKLNSSNNAKYLKFHWQKVESTRNSELWQLSRRFQTLIWRPGEMVQNRESPGLYRRVDSTAGSCWDWLFDQVWCSKVEQESSYDSWNMVKDPYKCLLFCDSVPQNPINSLKYFSLFCLTVKFVMHLLLGRN